MNYFSKIFQQTSWQILGKAVTSFSTFIILGLIARNYGSEGMGVFTLALTYLAIFYMLADFGFNAHILKKFRVQGPGSGAEWNKLLGTRIVWSVAMVAIAIGLLPILPFTTPDFEKAVFFGSLAIIGSAVFVTCNAIFQSKLRYDLSVFSSSIGTLISLLVFVVLSVFKFPIPFLLFAHFLGWIVIAFIALFLVKKFLSKAAPLFDFSYAKNLFKESWPIAATLSLNILYFRADAFMIAHFKSASDVGIYNIAYSVFQSALVLPTFIMNAYYPLMLKSLAKAKLILLGLLGLSLAGTLVTFIIAPLVIEILTGGGFVGSSQVLQILSLGFPAYFVSALLMWILISRGKYRSMFLLYTSGMIFNIILNYFYIPKYSYLAASWTTVISEYFILALQVMVLWRRK